MFTYAFMVDSIGETPESYSWDYENEEMKFRYIAVNGMEIPKEYAKKLADEGFECIDLCGAFDAEKAKEISNVAGSKVEVEYSKYSDSEIPKLDEITDDVEYGLIIMAEGLPEGTIKIQEIKNSEFNSTIALVDSDENAKAVAKDFVERGIELIDLCSYFDEAKAKEIIDAIDGKVPVGYCG